MAGSSEVRTLLSRHKVSLLCELNTTDLLNVLVKRGVITEIDKDAVAGNVDRSADSDVDLFIDIIGAKGFDAFREFCLALEAKCPHVLTNILVDHNLAAEDNQQQFDADEEEEAKREKKLREQEAVDEEDDFKIDNNVTVQQQQQQQQQHQQQQQQQQGVFKNNYDGNQTKANGDMNVSRESINCIKECPEVIETRRLSSYPDNQQNSSSPINSEQISLLQNHHRTSCVLQNIQNGSLPHGETIEVLDEPVDEPVGDRGWEVHHVTVTRVPGYGFGIAVSGGRDNPHFTNGDPAIAISDVLKAGPAEGKLQVNDRIISANGVSLEGADYGAAVRVLRDSGSTVLLIVKRRSLSNNLSSQNSVPQSHRLTLTRNNKKDDFGIVLGCRLFVKEVTREGTGAKPGDIVTRIGGVAVENMSLKEARKMMDQCKDRLSIVVTRDAAVSGNNYQTKADTGEYLSGASYSSQNLYVPPPTRQPLEDKSNLAPRGRSRGPLMDVSLSQLDLPATPTVDPPRPPPPRLEDYYSSRREIYNEDPLSQRSKQPMPDPRFITFQKEGSVPVHLTGGNETGVFVTAVQPGSPASQQGLQPGDKILKVNGMDMKNVTREEAVLFLHSLEEQIDLIVQHRRTDYEQIISSGRGDSFYIKTHFHYEQPDKNEMSFRSGDIFHVIDTLYNNVVGSWEVFRIGRSNREEQKGIIPNKSRAEELATAQFNATKKELNTSENRGNFFRRRRGSHRRSKSLGRDHWDDVVFSDSVSKFPAYERVVLRHPGFIRPIILFGPVADLAREKLLKDFPDKFTSPQMESQIDEGGKCTKSSGIIRLSAIREVMDRGKHALLDITPNAVDRLNYAQFYPIVIFLQAESKQVIKEMRAGIPKSAHKSSKKLLEQCQKLDKIWGHVFSAVINLNTSESWYRALREQIDRQQQGSLWMSQTKPEEALSDDFLFPMTSRLSYASSPESDLELSPAPPLPGALGPPSRLKSSSDPSIATQDDTTAPPPYTSSYQAFEQHKRSQAPPSDSKYGFSTSSSVNDQLGLPQYPAGHTQTRSPHQGPPDLPPRIDRNVKPPGQNSRGTIGRSAVERLFNNKNDPAAMDMGNYINATPHRANASSSLERAQLKAGSYDSMSSYDSYNTNGNPTYTATTINQSAAGRLGPNVPDDLKTGNMQTQRPPHDPYRFTRTGTQQILNQDQQARTDYAKYSRTGDQKTTTGKDKIKPVVPPKPSTYRNYSRPTQQQLQQQQQQQIVSQDETNGGNMYQHAKSYSMNTSLLHNGVENGVNVQRNSGQYYYNVPPPNREGNYHMNTSHSHNHTSPNHSHSLSHTHQHSNPPITAHSHSNSAGQLTLGHSHNRNVSMNGHSHSNSHGGGTGHIPSGGNSNHNSSNNREPSGLDLAGSREQRGSAFELYRKAPLHHNVRSTGVTRGVFDAKGGVLKDTNGVSLTIPQGAISPKIRQEIYFAVTSPHNVDARFNSKDLGRRASLSPPMHNGESLLSPLVECGPRGLEFNKPVELRIPHNATPAHKLALKAADIDARSSNDWLDVRLPEPTSDYILVKLDHF